MNKPVRFFAGLGFGGFFAIDQSQGLGYTVTVNRVLQRYLEGGYKLCQGVFPRLGVEFNRFAPSLEYDFILSNIVRSTQFLYSYTLE